MGKKQQKSKAIIIIIIIIIKLYLHDLFTGIAKRENN